MRVTIVTIPRNGYLGGAAVGNANVAVLLRLSKNRGKRATQATRQETKIPVRLTWDTEGDSLRSSGPPPVPRDTSELEAFDILT